MAARAVDPVVDRIGLCDVKAAAHVRVSVGGEGSCRCPSPMVDGGRARESERRIWEPGAVPESSRVGRWIGRVVRLFNGSSTLEWRRSSALM